MVASEPAMPRVKSKTVMPSKGCKGSYRPKSPASGFYPVHPPPPALRAVAMSPAPKSFTRQVCVITARDGSALAHNTL